MSVREVIMSSKRYTDEFKIEAVKQVVEDIVQFAFRAFEFREKHAALTLEASS